jgi:hypothetical protein
MESASLSPGQNNVQAFRISDPRGLGKYLANLFLESLWWRGQKELKGVSAGVGGSRDGFAEWGRAVAAGEFAPEVAGSPLEQEERVVE